MNIIIALCIILLLVYIVELFNLHQFKLRFFDFGVKIYSKRGKIISAKWFNKDGIYEEKIGRYVFIPDLKQGYFVTRFEFYRRYGIWGHSMGNKCTIFGEFVERSNELVVVYKVSYRIVVLIFAWYALLLSVFIYNMDLKSFIGSAVFMIISSALLYLYYYFQKRRMSRLFDELIKVLKE